MGRLSISDLAAASVEVDLWGKEFLAVPITRSRQKCMEAIQQQIIVLDENDREGNDKAVALLAEMLDQQLMPAVDGGEKASAVIVAKWQADELTFDQLVGFQERLSEAVRPT